MKVHDMGHGAEFGWTVKGALTVQEAREALVEHLILTDYCDGYRVLIDSYRVAVDTRPNGPRWFRWNPCHPSSCFDGGGHFGHLETTDGPGRGNWLGVELARW